MSGPKCSEYEVRRNEEILRLARQAAWAEARAIENSLENLSSNSDLFRDMAFTAMKNRPTPNAPPEEIDTYSEGLRDCLNSIDRQVRQKKVTQALEAFSSSISLPELTQERSMPTDKNSRGAGNPAESSLSDRTALVKRILGRLPILLSTDEEQQLLDIGEEIVSKPSRAKLLEADLRIRVQQINREYKRITDNQRRAEDLASTLRGLKGAEVDSLLAELSSYSDGKSSVPRTLEERIVTTGDSVRKRMNAEYVAETITKELLRLGYEVGEDFSTLIVRKGRPEIIHRPGSAYGMSVHVDASCGEIDFELVREGDPGARLTLEQKTKDTAAETEYCQDCHSIFDRLTSEGVGNRITKNAPIGQQAVRVISSDKRRSNRRSTFKSTTRPPT